MLNLLSTEKLKTVKNRLVLTSKKQKSLWSFTDNSDYFQRQRRTPPRSCYLACTQELTCHKISLACSSGTRQSLPAASFSFQSHSIPILDTLKRCQSLMFDRENELLVLLPLETLLLEPRWVMLNPSTSLFG